MNDQFRSDARIGAVTVPTLVLHGELDRVVPDAFGERCGISWLPRRAILIDPSPRSCKLAVVPLVSAATAREAGRGINNDLI